MQNLLFLALAFIIPCLSHLLLQTTLNAFTSGASWDPFEPRGSAWIAIKSIYYGTIGLLAGMAISQIVKPPGPLALLLCATAVALGTLDMRLNFDDDNEVRNSEKLIALIGEGVLKFFPYIAQDTPLPADANAILAPGQTVIAKDKATGTKMTITAGSGSMRTFCWDGVTRSVDVFKEDNEIFSNVVF